MKKINLIYFKDKSVNGNFGDELSKFITTQLINKDKYALVIVFCFNSSFAIALSLERLTGNLIWFFIKSSSSCEIVSLLELLA